MKPLRIISCLFLSVAFTTGTSSAAVFDSPVSGVDLSIPDDGSTVSDARTITTDLPSMVNVSVTLTLAGTGDGAWNGDYYATLTHDGGFAVLLNRVGRRAGSTVSYSDNGFSAVTFDDNSANGDVYICRPTLNGSNTTPLGGALTRIWAPRGRNVDPNNVLVTTTPSTRLSSFAGLAPTCD